MSEQIYVFVLTAIISGGLGLLIGWCMGTDGFNQKTYWKYCVFYGPPPHGYDSWSQWINSKAKMYAKITRNDVPGE